MLLGGTELPVSSFSSRTPPLSELVAACSRIPIIVLSYGNAVLSAGELCRAASSDGRRIATVVEVPYQHLRSVASREKNNANREVIVVATKDVQSNR